MTTDTTSLRSLDAALARALGWTQRPSGHWAPPGWTGDMPLPDFASLPNATHLFEDEIERRGLWKEYTVALRNAVCPYGDMSESGIQWSLIRATPEQRARAALAVLSAHQISSSDA